VSTIATIEMPSRWASATAIFSLRGSMMNHGRRQLLHRLDADQRLLELLALAVELERLFLGHPLVLARLLHLLELLEPGDRFANGPRSSSGFRPASAGSRRTSRSG
jgi:hypothetical protein